MQNFILMEHGNKASLLSDNLEIQLEKKGQDIIIRKIEDGHETNTKKVHEIDSLSGIAYNSLGGAGGQSLFHCFYLAFKYRDGFYEEITAFSAKHPDKPNINTQLSFYGSKKLPN